MYLCCKVEGFFFFYSGTLSLDGLNIELKTELPHIKCTFGGEGCGDRQLTCR